MLLGVLSATLEVHYGTQEAVIEPVTPVVLTTNVQPARSFCALRTSEDSIRAILSVSVAFQAGGRFQVQRSECLGGSIMSAVAVAALSTLQSMVSTVNFVLTMNWQAFLPSCESSKRRISVA
jgi:hypothetical protein